MNSLLKSENVASSELLITIATYLLFAAALVLALLLNKVSGASESIWSERFRTSSAGALVATLAAGWLFTLGFRRAAADRRTKFWFPVFANVLVVLFCLVLSEVGLRRTVSYFVRRSAGCDAGCGLAVHSGIPESGSRSQNEILVSCLCERSRRALLSGPVRGGPAHTGGA